MRQTITVESPNTEWFMFFLGWLEQMLQENYNDQDKFGMVQIKTDTEKRIVVTLLSLDAR